MVDKELEQQYYAQLYSAADSDHDGKISGFEGVTFFRKSGLPDPQLEKVWDVADQMRVGYLTQREFAIAMRMVALAQEGKVIAFENINNVTKLPKFEGISLPLAFPTSFTEQELFKYDNLFLQADLNKDGFVDGMEAKNYFSKGKLNQQQLARVWTLSETDNDGKLNLGEFRIAMHLIYWAMKGHAIPDFIPKSIVTQALTAPSQVVGRPPVVSNSFQPTPISNTSSFSTMPTSTSYQQTPISNSSSFNSVGPSTSFSSTPVPSSSSFPSVGPSQPITNSFSQPGWQTFSSANSNVEFEAAPAKLNLDQSKLIAQHTLPSASFEQRANFTSELQDALNKRKQ